MTAARRDILITLIGCAIVVAMITAVRWFGPGDLYEKDQPKTIAYTADVVLHHRFALPRDVIYQPATKPPMYNWIGAAAVWIIGSWGEWTLKFPSVLGTALTAACIAIATRRAMRSEDKSLAAITAMLAIAIFFTFGSDVRHGSVIRLSYLARPDMLQCGFLTAAWLCAWIAVDQISFRRSILPATLFWICITGAILTKGPAAAMGILFAGVYTLSRTENAYQDISRRGVAPASVCDRAGALPRRDWFACRLSGLARVHWEIGIPLVLLCVGAWLYAAYRQDPQHVRDVMLGAEIGSRLTEESPEGFRKPIYFAIMWFVTKALPWGGLALLSIGYFVSQRRRVAMPLATIVWLVVLLVCLSLPAGKRIDYALPAYAPAAVLVSVMLVYLVRLLRAPAWLPILLPVLIATFLSHRFLTRFHESLSHNTDNAIAFTTTVREKVKPTDHLLVLVRGKHPLPTLLGRHQGSFLTSSDLKGDAYVIMPEQPDLQPILVSAPLPIGFDDIEKRDLAKLGLYYFPKSDKPIERLVELQKQIGTWTQTENPYHAPGTVYRDE